MDTNEDHWRKHIQAFEKDDIAGTVYCKNHGLSYQNFRYWLKKFGTNKKPKQKASSQGGKFLPLKPLDTSSLILKVYDAEIKITKGFSPDLLKALIRTLRSC